MPTTTSTLSLTDRIQGLLDERQQLTQAIAALDKTLEQVNALLDAPSGSAMPARKPPIKPAIAPTLVQTPAQRRQRPK